MSHLIRNLKKAVASGGSGSPHPKNPRVAPPSGVQGEFYKSGSGGGG